MTITGQSGSVRWGYLEALRFRAWRFEGTSRHGGQIVGTVEGEPDAFRVTQAPLEVWLDMGQAGAGRWPVLALSLGDGQLSASVGPRHTAQARGGATHG